MDREYIESMIEELEYQLRCSETDEEREELEAELDEMYFRLDSLEA